MRERREEVGKQMVEERRKSEGKRQVVVAKGEEGSGGRWGGWR